MAEAPAEPLRIGFEIAQSLGLLGALCALLLCLLPVRPRTPATHPLGLRVHELLGWGMFIAALTHVALSLAFDHMVSEHLKKTAPYYEWAGICALVAVLLLTVPATAAIRRRLWSRHRNFQALHVILSCLLVALIAVHVLSTDRYLHGRMRTALWLLLSIAALLGLLRARASHAQLRLGLINRLAFGRHSKLILVTAVLTCLALLPLLSHDVRRALRAPLMRRTSTLVLDFPHDRHLAVNCIECHHNFRDQTGTGLCISCHRSNRPEILVGAEARFHDFCLGCHRDPPAPLTRHGPVSGCESCHTAPHERAPGGGG